MEMTYHEPQTPLFPPSYVNLVNAKDHWTIGESEHNTDCDVTVRITNSYAPIICITSPMLYASRTIRSSAGIVKKQARTTEKMEINVILEAVQGVWSAGMGWCLYSERHGKQITRSNKITRVTKGTWLAASGSLLHYSTWFHLPHKQSKERWGWWRMIYRSWAPLTSVWSCKMCGNCPP